MKRFLTITTITLTVAAAMIFNYTNFFNASAVGRTKSETKISPTETYGKVPLSFEPNAGQTDAQVKFLSRGAGYALFLTATEAVLRLKNGDCKTAETKDCPQTSGVLRMRFENANPNPQVSGAGELSGKSNYLNLDGAGEKITDVPNFERVNYGGIYKGIDLVFYGSERQLEYDFNVAPNADPTQIKLNFDGAEKLSIDGQGNLVAEVAGKNAQFNAPVAYQTINGERRGVAANYLIENNSVKFELGDYDESETLVIDPILQYSSYLGGSGYDEAKTIAVNAAGEAYIAGQTYSTNFPTANAVQPNLVGTSDGFLTKFNASGSGVVFSTYLGGAGDQIIYNIALDAANNVSIAGSDSRNSDDVYIGKLNAAGNALVYPTVFIGGSSSDSPGGLALDAAGNAYVTGTTYSTNFPTTAGVIQPNDGAGGGAFAARVNTNGAIAYSTYLDGAGDEQGLDLAVDSAGNAYIVGNRNFNNVGDGFILKLNPTATALVYPTFYIGGAQSDAILNVEIDGSGNAYVCGQTVSDDFPTTAGVIQPTRGGDYDGFAAKVNASGNGLIWSTYLGGIGADFIHALKLDSAGGIYVGGTSTITGDSNLFAAHLNPTATAIDYNAQFGGLSPEILRGMAIDANDNIYLAGETGSTDYPTTVGAFDRTYNGAGDAFVMKINAPESSGSTTLNVSVAGNAVVNAEQFVAQIRTGDTVTINNISGTVNFNTQAPEICVNSGVVYNVNANGLLRSTFNDSSQAFCYQETCNDPLTASNNGHAGLYVMRGAAKTFIGLSGTTFTATADQPLYLGVNDCSGAGSERPNSGSFNARVTITPASSTTLNVNVPGNAVLNAEKFVTQLNAGDQVTINNIGGQVDFQTINRTNGCIYVVNANGLNRVEWNDSNSILFCQYANPPVDPLTGANDGHAGLYMMRGAAKTFIGLNGAAFTATADQPLYLGVNDVTGAGSVTPNSGSFNATVTINRAASIEPTLSADTVGVLEGNSGTTNAAFTVSLSPESDQTVTVRYQTANGTATAGTDYTATGGTLTFAPGETAKTVNVPVIGDTTDEPAEYFTLQLINPTKAQTVIPRGRANITDDDAVPTISITDASVTEGNSGTTNAVFNVSLSSLSGNTVTVNYATSNGTATAPADYTATSGTLNFAPGTTSKTVSVPIVGDTLIEPNETFNVNLSGATNATISDALGIGTIINDDSCAYSISPSSQSVPATATNGTFGVTTQPGCAWTAGTSASWITITGGASGSGSGTVSFTVAANTGAARTGTIIAAGLTFTVNQAAATPTPTPTPTPTGTVSGRVTYANAPTTTGVPFTTINAAGSIPLSTMTDANGFYSISGFGSGAYTITPSKANQVNGISNLDASRIAQHIVGLTVLNANQLIAADTSGNGSVSSLDASYIAQFVASIANPSITGTWKFLPASRSYPNVLSNQTNQDFSAILVGDVTGNWNPAGPLGFDFSVSPSDQTAPADKRRQIIYAIDTSANQSAEEKTGLTVNLMATDTTGEGILSYQFDLLYDAAVIEPQAVSCDVAETISRGMSAVCHAAKPGVLKVVVFGTTPMSGMGTLLKLKFEIVGATGSTSPLSIKNFRFNEDLPQEATIDGRVMVAGSTADTVSIR